MLLTMRSLTQAARAICYTTALAIDRGRTRRRRGARKSAFEQASLLTPVAKAFSTDIGNEVTSLGIQVHGGMGYIEETGAAQLFRDARIATIYEGTNGIQAIDLVTRKLPLADGAAVDAHLDDLRGIVRALDASNDPAFGWTAVRLGDAVESLARATTWLLSRLDKEPEAALAGATPYLRLFGASDRRLPPRQGGPGGDQAWRRRDGAHRHHAVFRREFRGASRRHRAHGSRVRAGRPRRRRGACLVTGVANVLRCRVASPAV